MNKKDLSRATAYYSIPFDNFSEIIRWDGYATYGPEKKIIKGAKASVVAWALNFLIFEKRLSKTDAIEFVKKLVANDLFSKSDFAVVFDGVQSESKS